MEVRSKGKVFITGITGFTGVYLEAKLKQLGFEVFGTTLSNPNSNNHIKCDILDEDSLLTTLKDVRPDYIFHLAAISFVASEDQDLIYRVNIFGSINLLNAVDSLDYIPAKIIIASSAAIYGRRSGSLDEKMCPLPVNHYGNSKLVMENMVRHYFDTQNIIIVRPFNYTGIGQDEKFLIPKIVSHYKRRERNIELGNIDVYREFNDIAYVIDCYIQLMNSTVSSEIVNVSSNNAINIKEILQEMNKIAGHEINVKVNPSFVRKNEIEILKGSTDKLYDLLGEKIKPIPLIELLSKMYKA
ncbi:GDP-mannose 4,6-dehydratase [Robertkochia aurantiaca]|uniref:GDP-mannose 4,6-dehydratase n=1 Tax=Robertkochia aurantiaca TaxID=2873700 RepID=UPI001CCE2A10|nr:GDP-mannose 4,6-dehydratase [Robertkochia sp. 3YJGBD-33]